MMSRYDFWERNSCKRLKTLMDQPLFEQCLAPDIANGEVFPAIRGQKIDFYSKGQKLFSFMRDAFHSNVAYLAAFEQRPKGEISEKQFRSLRVCHSFQDGYKQIKKNLAQYEQPESGGVFRLCKKFSSFKNESPPAIGVLDIELSLESQDEERSQDRIDLVLYKWQEKQLRFFEVKTLSNSEIWPRNGELEVQGQISRYTSQLKRRHANLLKSYQQYVRLMNQMLSTSLPEPDSIDAEVDLLLIGFNKQQEPIIKTKLMPVFEESGFFCSKIGSTSSASLGSLEKWWARSR